MKHRIIVSIVFMSSCLIIAQEGGAETANASAPVEADVASTAAPQGKVAEQSAPAAPAPGSQSPVSKELSNQPSDAAPANQSATPANAGSSAAPASGDATAAEPAESVQGIDTISLQDPAGNWLFKRGHYDNGKKKYEQIKTAVKQLLDARMQFFSERYKLDNEVLRPFYFDLGLRHGELEGVVKQLLADIEKERAVEGGLSLEEKEVLKKVEDKQALLEGIKNRVKRIKDLDRQLNEALTLLMDQVNVAEKYEDEAWQHFNAIAMELSEKNAKKLFYKMDALWQNVQGVVGYVQQAFSQHFGKVVKQIKEDVVQVNKSVEELQAAGVNLRQEFDKIQQQEEAALRQEKEKKEALNKPREESKPEVEHEDGWFASITSVVGSFFQGIWDAVKAPFVWMFGGSAEHEEGNTEKTVPAAEGKAAA